MHMRTPRPWANTHTHTLLCGYGLSTGPTGGLSSWWNRSPPNNNNNNCLMCCVRFVLLHNSKGRSRWCPQMPARVQCGVEFPAGFPAVGCFSCSSADNITDRHAVVDRRQISVGMRSVAVGVSQRIWGFRQWRQQWWKTVSAKSETRFRSCDGVRERTVSRFCWLLIKTRMIIIRQTQKGKAKS